MKSYEIKTSFVSQRGQRDIELEKSNEYFFLIAYILQQFLKYNNVIVRRNT